jgi:hypothetical protein
MSLGKTSLRETLLGKISLGKTFLGETFLGKTLLGKISLGKTLLGEMFLGKKSLGKKALGEKRKANRHCTHCMQLFGAFWSIYVGHFPSISGLRVTGSWGRIRKSVATLRRSLETSA